MNGVFFFVFSSLLLAFSQVQRSQCFFFLSGGLGILAHVFSKCQLCTHTYSEVGMRFGMMRAKRKLSLERLQIDHRDVSGIHVFSVVGLEHRSYKESVRVTPPAPPLPARDLKLTKSYRNLLKLDVIFQNTYGVNFLYAV